MGNALKPSTRFGYDDYQIANKVINAELVLGDSICIFRNLILGKFYKTTPACDLCS